MPRYDYSREEVCALVEWHMARQEEFAKEVDAAVAAYNAKVRDGIDASVEDDEAVARNLAYETGDALASTLVPRSPELKIYPKRTDLVDAAEAQEGLVSELYTQADAEGVLRKAVTLAAIADYSIVKTVWKGRKHRPHYRAISPKNVFFDLNAEEWDEIAYIGEITVKTLPELKARARRTAKGQPRYKTSIVDLVERRAKHLPDWLKTDGIGEKTTRVMIAALKQVVVVELIMFDRVNGGRPRLLHVVPGIEEPLLDMEFPHLYLENPYSLVVLEVALDGLTGTNPYKLVKRLGMALNQMESLRMETARAAIPVPIMNAGQVANKDAFLNAYRNATSPNDVVEIELATNTPITDVLMFSTTPGTVVDFAQAINALEMLIQSTLGIPSYLRAGNSGADFAAEIQLQSHELATRAGARRKIINKVLVEMGVKGLQLYNERLGHDDVVYVRAAEGEKPKTIGREIAALHLFNAANGETPLEMDYTVKVVDEATQNPAVRLQALQPYLPLLLKLSESNMVQAPPIVMQLLRWLGLEKAIPANPEDTQLQQAAAGAASTAVDVPGVSGSQGMVPKPPTLPQAPEVK